MNNKYQNWLKTALFSILAAAVGFFACFLFVDPPHTVRKLGEENSRLLTQYNVLGHRLDDAMGVLSDIQQRDDNLYRVLLMADPVSKQARQAGFGGTNRYEELEDLQNADLVIDVTQKMDLLTKQLYIQSSSFDEVVEFFRNHEDMLAHLPAIMPISNRDLKHTASGYGWRVDPVYGTRKFHHGMDFTCDKGTPVYATADGTVVQTDWQSGYGMTITIDHGYGYRTRFAHLSAYKVRRGDKVVRAQLIALSGNTGKTTGPHVHYEVYLKDHDVNPVNYYFMDLDAEHYEEIVQLAENHGKMLD